MVMCIQGESLNQGNTKASISHLKLKYSVLLTTYSGEKYSVTLLCNWQHILLLGPGPCITSMTRVELKSSINYTRSKSCQ